MIVGTAVITLLIPGARSLKDKRSVVKSLLARMRNEFNISAAEVDAQQAHDRAVLGVACVSSSAEYARGQLDAVLRWVEAERPDIPVVSHEIELL